MECIFGSLKQWLEIFNNFRRHCSNSFCPSPLLLELYLPYIKSKNTIERKALPISTLWTPFQGSPRLKHSDHSATELSPTNSKCGRLEESLSSPALPCYSQKPSSLQIPSPSTQRALPPPCGKGFRLS